MMRVLVVEDEPHIANDLKDGLTQAGYVVDVCRDGEKAWFLGETEDFDAMLIDLGLPRMDGLQIIRRLRMAGITTPILVLTARGAWMERVEGIDAGADDYVPKPFHMEEVLARLGAILRRTGGHASPVIEVGALRIDTRRMQALLGDRQVPLSSLEYRLLRYLAHNKGRVVSQPELGEHVYGSDREPDSNALEVLIARLRRKIGNDIIGTRRGHGYYLVVGETTPNARTDGNS
jgi:two-component system, OmpR family, response regulator